MRISDWSSDVCSSDLLDVLGNDKKWRRVFSGWLFEERPERNVVQHEIYDVWVKSCKMSWPDNGPDTVQPRKSGSVANASNAEKSPEANDGEDAPAPPAAVAPAATAPAPTPAPANTPTSEERRVGNECVSTFRPRGPPYT